MNISNFNNRMVEGQPIHYYSYHQYPDVLSGSPPLISTSPPWISGSPPSSDFSYFNRFDCFRTMEQNEDFQPSSPGSNQSDSENSISSVEVSPKQIRVKKTVTKPVEGEKTEVQCCWKSCGLFFPSLDQLGSHVSKVHASGGPGGLYYCGWEGCARNNKGFNARYKMLVHVRTHTNEKPHQCCQCDKSFSRAENLKIHSRSHSGEKPYVCPVPGCNKAYSNSSDRFKHTRTHQVEKPYQCKVPGCPKRYTDPSSLRKHVKTYKHFVETSVIKKIEKEDQIVKENIDLIKESIPVEHRLVPKSMTMETAENNTLSTSPCKCCSHVCCESINKAAEMLRIGAVINLKRDEAIDNWGPRLIQPYMQMHEKKLYKPYELDDNPLDNNRLMDVSMDVDVPLDLSIRRHHS